MRLYNIWRLGHTNGILKPNKTKRKWRDKKLIRPSKKQNKTKFSRPRPLQFWGLYLKAITTATKMKTVFPQKLLHQHGDRKTRTQKQKHEVSNTSLSRDRNSRYVMRTQTELNVIELDQCLYSRDILSPVFMHVIHYNASFATGFLYTLHFVFTSHTRIVSSFQGKILLTRGRSQSPLWVFSRWRPRLNHQHWDCAMAISTFSFQLGQANTLSAIYSRLD